MSYSQELTQHRFGTTPREEIVREFSRQSQSIGLATLNIADQAYPTPRARYVGFTSVDDFITTLDSLVDAHDAITNPSDPDDVLDSFLEPFCTAPGKLRILMLRELGFDEGLPVQDEEQDRREDLDNHPFV